MLIEEKILQTIYNTSPDAIIVIDGKGIVLSFNKMAESLFGYAASDVVWQNIKMLMPPYFAHKHDGHLERYRRTGERHIIGIGRIVTGQRKDGSVFPMELSIGEAKTQTASFFTGFVRDLTERQQFEQRVHELQEELIHAARLASLGEIVSMVAHEVNQPLSATGTYLEVACELLTRDAEGDRLKGLKAIDQARTQVKRAGDTVRRIRDFARKKTPDLAIEDVNRMIEEANAIASVGTKAKNIRTTFDLSPELPQAQVDRVQIQQVIMNLVRNAIDALESSSTREIILQSRFVPEGRVEISIHDSGLGVSSDIAKQIFVPFVTSKKDGTGLGLAICRTIVEAHGGKLWAERSPLGGAAFRFTLPLKPEHEEAANVSA